MHIRIELSPFSRSNEWKFYLVYFMFFITSSLQRKAFAQFHMYMLTVANAIAVTTYEEYNCKLNVVSLIILVDRQLNKRNDFEIKRKKDKDLERMESAGAGE